MPVAIPERSLFDRSQRSRGGRAPDTQTNRIRRVAMLMVVLAAGGACTTVREGAPQRDPADDRQAVSVALLDPGNYPTHPRPPLGVAGTAFAGAKIEARRMADFMVLPFQVDLRMSYQQSDYTGVVQDVQALHKAELSDPIPSGAEGHNFVCGFTVYANSGEPVDTGPVSAGMQNTVVRFATPADAAAAAVDMSGRSATINRGPPYPPIPTRPVGIPRHPDATAVAYDDSIHDHFVLSYTPHGPYLLIQEAQSQGGADAAAALVATALDMQQPLIDTFAATPIDQLVALPVDPTGLLARMVPTRDDERTVDTGTYGTHGTLAFTANPRRDQTLYADTGMTLMAKAKVNVYQARDHAGAIAIVDDFATRLTGTSSAWGYAGAVTGMPEGKCLQSRADPANTGISRVYCVAPAGRYAIEVITGQKADAYQILAAQYLMLTTN
jgi:hypothetical protein